MDRASVRDGDHIHPQNAREEARIRRTFGGRGRRQHERFYQHPRLGERPPAAKRQYWLKIAACVPEASAPLVYISDEQS